MQKYYTCLNGFEDGVKLVPDADGDLYLAADVDALLASHIVSTDQSNLQALHDRIAELEKALRDAIVWNWAEWKNHDSMNPPGALVDRISSLLAT